MLTTEQEPTEPWGELIEPWGPVSRKLPAALFVGALLFMCLCEAIVIHGAWFKPRPPLTTIKRLDLAIYVLLPGFLAFIMRVVISRQSRVGQISLPAAAMLKNWLSVLLMFTYLALLEFVSLAFP